MAKYATILKILNAEPKCCVLMDQPVVPSKRRNLKVEKIGPKVRERPERPWKVKKSRWILPSLLDMVDYRHAAECVARFAGEKMEENTWLSLSADSLKQNLEFWHQQLNIFLFFH